jgi:serine/threonine protein kinase
MDTQRYGRYTLIEQIGQGGMSVVYQARDPVLDRFVALKLLHPHLAERADSRARFAREAKAVARLKHPNIMEVFDYAPAESMRSYIVTEYINGPTLRQFLGEDTLRSPEAAVILLQPIADALARAHDAGIVHRDVKPENIMVREDGSPVLMDFGIAQMIDMPTLTATGTILGSPAHMAPEVIDGSTVDSPADVFSFGTVLYWCISGYLPFTGPNPSALFRRILETDFDPLSKHSEAAGQSLGKLVSDCLEKDANLRPSARQVSARMKLHLESLGLAQPNILRKRLIQDRPNAELEIIDDTVGHLLDIADTELKKASIPVLLDYVNRALAHRPNDARAIKLLGKLTNRRQTRRLFYGLLLAFVCLGLTATVIEHAKPLMDYIYPTNQSIEAPVSAEVATMDSMAANITGTTPDARFEVSDAKAAVVDTGLDASLIASPMDASRPVKPTATALKPTQLKSRLAKKKLKPKLISQPTQPKPVTVLPTGPLTRVQVSSELQGARIIVDGKLHPEKYLSKVRTSGGLRLPPGTHRIEIENLGCKTEAYDRTIIVGQKVPPIFHDCKWLDSYLRIESNEAQLEIRDRNDKNQRILGETNQRITLDMEAYRMTKRLMIRQADDSFVTLSVNLTAGETTVIKPKPQTRDKATP